jgi:light-harvesting complex 1 beta chain
VRSESFTLAIPAARDGRGSGFRAELKECQVMADNRESLTGLTDAEAREVHGYMIQGYIAFVAVAVVAHFLVWQWRPWFPTLKGYVSLDNIGALTSLIG